MGIIVLLISISITIALLFLGIFLWSLKDGQFDDTTTPAMRMIFDDIKGRTKVTSKKVSAPAPASDKNQARD
jgi:cbb3-type cytochrome oxidase maturation protein